MDIDPAFVVDKFRKLMKLMGGGMIRTAMLEDVRTPETNFQTVVYITMKGKKLPNGNIKATATVVKGREIGPN